MENTIIDLRNINKIYGRGESKVQVLYDVNVKISSGELVAIVGSSGSGKSTLMNILGCLDKQTSGEYWLNNNNIQDMDGDDLAQLRREYFGFIFQRYHLLNVDSALENVEVPAIYSGIPEKDRKLKAKQILESVGLFDKVNNLPSQLSGGQQQRVSISRALMNGGHVILADEPTGALDSVSGKQVMEILKNLHSQGHTIIIVTHDMNVANYANRIIEIKDGYIINDTKKNTTPDVIRKIEIVKERKTFSGFVGRFKEAFKIAVKSILSNKLRSTLTMLGIIIGIASVVSVVALGKGSSEKIISSISSLGTNTIDIYTGKGFGDRSSGQIRTLSIKDVRLLDKQSFIDSVSPNVSTSVLVTYKNTSLQASIKGVGSDFFRVKDINMELGKIFDEQDVASQAQYAVIDNNTKVKLFKNEDNIIGKVLILGNVPVKIVAVAEKKESAFGNNESLNIFIPYTTSMSKLENKNFLQSVTVRIKDGFDTSAAESAINNMMETSHGIKDFFTVNSDSIKKTIEDTTATMTLLISAIAVISLIVGGVGVMNIMLVSVTERKKEIGVRMAIGARKNDILQQFLIESTLICLVGGLIGVLLSLFIGFAFNSLTTNFTMIYSIPSIIIAFVCSTIIGILFGYLPAKNAANLDPVIALASD